MTLYALTIFTSAFLLFLVQPIIAKQILPWFGGSAAVWTTCLVFFQFLLLAGYAYSDWTTRKLSARSQVVLHVVLLAASLVSLPITADTGWKPAGDEDPTWRILGLLTVTIGLPYFLLSTTGPLVQAWFARTFPAGTVYRLFALSNFGSLLALASYPFAFEPWITTAVQSWGWSAAYAAFVALCAASAWYSLRGAMTAAARETVSAPDADPPPRPGDYAAWLLLSGMGAFMLLAVTNHITHDIASVPFLWILPLTLYLLTFILCFEGRGWYQRRIFIVPLAAIVCAMAWAMHEERGIMEIKEAVPLGLVGLFVMCMFFHGELAARKPAPRYLTSFYLMVSLGGALGGIAVGVVAVKLFNTYYEFGAGLVVTLLVAAYVTRLMHSAVPMLVLAAVGFTGYHVYAYIGYLAKDTRVMTRNFYGTLRVKDIGADAEQAAVRRLMHGVIMHGEQYLAPARRREPTTYYGETSGVARAINALDGSALRVGVVGLGTGTLALFGRPGDVYRFYEINPQVVEIANSEFTFLSDSAARIEHVLGDARLAMEREPPQNYDVLVIDAFSSDSIPVHLITSEALAVYARHTKPGGVIAFHVTNRFLDLAPVVKSIADEHGLHAALISDDAEESDLARTDWVLVTRNKALLERPEIAKFTSEIETVRGLRVWTDDFNNLFRILK
ncbi:MAG TPA: fused MFS/spermidine synthase [Burkholderiales bacterium]|nr:fused MFS/spermidine synthase [Burkholderiales bacterium]